MLETTRCAAVSRRFEDLRGVQWRIDLGILPSSPSASVDDLRRVTADSRRRYAALRRQLLVDPHVPKDGGNSPDVVIDNPLSQNPDSMWGRFFKNAELERMVDQDLTRLYPERGSYFQTNGCQSMLRRILLLWCLRHPDFGYRQGMHELLAPLLYVLHADVERLLEVRKTYDDQFADKFDGFSFHENDLTYRFDFKKFSESMDHGDNLKKNSTKPGSLGELDPQIQTIILLSDAYGAEGELGIVLSEKFMEHDAYSMFDALMNGAGGAVAMAEFFYPSPVGSSQTGFPPVIEASAALYHLLSIADSSLYSHLVELGVEPQYFALRWLRVLFGREFSLEDILLIWDEIFAHENSKCNKGPEVNADCNFGILESPRGAFICAFAVSMILNLRSSLLATENATICLKRLLNFPEDVKLVKLLEKAKSLHPLALDANNSNSIPIYPGLYDGRPMVARRHSLSLDGSSPKTPLNMVSDSYWEEKWRGLHKEEKNARTSSTGEQVPNRRKGWTERVRLRLSRTESDPSPAKEISKTKIPKPSVRRNLLKDLERQLGFDDDKESTTCNEDAGHQDSLEVHHQDSSEVHRQDSLEGHHQDSLEGHHQDSLEVSSDDIIVKDNGAGSSGAASEENVSNLSYPSSPSGGSSYDNENEQEPERPSSVASNSSVDGNYAGTAESSVTISECSSLPMSDPSSILSSEHPQNGDPAGKVETSIKDRKHILGKFQWLWKFARNAGDDVTEKTSAPEDPKTCNEENEQKSVVSVSTADTCKGEVVDQNLMFRLNNLGQSMLENIQVIETAFQQDRGQPALENFSKNGLVGKGQVTAMTALKELRKISNLLSEM